ncbi:midasin isoform X2 [Drosophila grimshawi]|uniref:GH14273 n=1 Tax=Drosophila grimshawi TaxID=7222 RepID=B4JYC8_DROGR|nr:midasin isoform X2 [Drosophila grimshawi]XP_032597503.1 midasin isoform X2 [Drosophila grimshawi]EDV90690.1 GH14273 [Drosophila grimshawi]
MGRLTIWFLLGLTLIAVSNNVGFANADVGPSESECRPYIEKAINELKTDGVTSGSGEVQADQPRRDDDDDDDDDEDAKGVNDIDGDGIPDDQDDDIDGDGIPNDEDDDIDGDGIPNEKDDDIDGDGIPNDEDDDIDGDGIPNEDDDDIDGDGIPNEKDDDIDGDGIPNEEDDDIDGDGIPNDEDDDIDGDGIPNEDDDDIDGDGIHNEKDDDIDGDGIPNEEDSDLDGDGLLNEKDEDLDGDGKANHEDDDIDGDGTLNHEDSDLDGDGLPNEKDEDLDGDGKANHEDEDIDGDGTLNHEDSDIDGDGVRNDEDHDVDGDGLSNSEEPQSMDIDGDGVPNALDDDIDGDNKVNEKDEDMDGDGILNVHDNDMDGDGIPNVHDDSHEVDIDEEEVKKRSKREVDAAPVVQVEEPASPAEEFPAEEEASKEVETAEAEVEAEPEVEEEEEVKEEEPEPEPVAAEEEAVEPEVEASVEVKEIEVAQDEPQETAVAADDDDDDTMPEDELLWEGAIPENRRSRQHISELLQLDEEFNAREKATDNVAEIILRDIKKIYENAVKPLETLYKYRDLSNRHFSDPEIFSKPLILFMGPWSGGKSSILNYLTDNEYTPNSLRTGAEPSPAYFNILMWGNETEVLDGTQLAADYTFAGLQKFGQGLEERLRGLKMKSKLLEKVNIVEIPGILEVRKQVSRVFPFNDACQWFIDRADIIFLVYDPAKLDVGPETEAILDQLKGREYQTRIILNKADTVKPEELLRVQGALIWNISPLMSSAQPPLMYTTSLWTHPYQDGAPARLLAAQERAFLRDLRTAIDKRIEHKIASARRFAVRVRNHAKMVDCYLNTFYNHKTLFGNKKRIADDIIDHPQNYHIYEGLSTLTNISRYDLPDPEVYRDFFRLNPLYEFKKLRDTCTYFRGCPITKLDLAIAYEMPELAGKYKKMSEAALAGIEAQAQAQAQEQASSPGHVQTEPKKTS